MNNQPLVCICIPNYNNEKTISETLDSLVNQTYKNIIIKIFDNASTDNSMKILKEYEKKYSNIQVFQNKTNIGGEGNFNKCIQNLEGEYGALYHSDDVYEPTIVEEQVKFLLENQKCVAVSTDMNLIDENSKRLYKVPLKEFFENKEFMTIDNQIEMLKKVLEIGNFIVCPSVMMKTEIYKNKIKKYDVENFKTAADFELWFRVLEFGKFGIILKPLINYRQSSNSYSFRTRLRTEESDGIKVVKHFYIILENELPKEYKRKLDFYIFKDNVIRILNQILVDQKDYNLKLNIFDLNVLGESLKTNKNLKFLLLG
ncbi:glycosyltransferase, partial [Aliarcobacter skirrowii]|uniref:glycosyltransferase n=1 Tax=Aliarcobacter skirrowii TaxID=28200 RepID=UPI0029B6CD81